MFGEVAGELRRVVLGYEEEDSHGVQVRVRRLSLPLTDISLNNVLLKGLSHKTDLAFDDMRKICTILQPMGARADKPC
jgi:hypothetical protein